MFSRIAIVNRGEAAMRLIHAVRDLSAETGTRVETVALYTDADRTGWNQQRVWWQAAQLRHNHPAGPHRRRPRR